MDGIGDARFPVSTKNVEAQRFVNQGFAMIYGFNHGEAARSFRRAAELDPDLAIAWWGAALTLGPNYNAPMDIEAHKQAWEALTEAKKRAGKATPRERDYIEALSVRYAEDPKTNVVKLQLAYADAMRSLAKKYPDDLDAVTLYAESLMNLNPWKLWSPDGKPGEHTEEIVELLESVLQRNPDHLGANHYYIHAVEASTKPQRALESANRLGRLAPAIGHLVHMPAHVFMRVGDYEGAARVNIAAAEADRVYLEKGGVKGIYLSYYGHNLHFLSAAYSMQGRYAEALRTAEECRRIVAPVAAEAPGLEAMMTAYLLVQVRFKKWDEILKQPAPASAEPALVNLYHFARGMAFAAKQKASDAARERDLFRAGIEKIPADRTFGMNTEQAVMGIAMHILEAKIAISRSDVEGAIDHLREAVAAEDRLTYNEPPDWYYPPSREALGAVLLSAGRAAEAESVFREDLKRNQRNGRSLFGLVESLRAQKNADNAAMIEPLYKLAWAKADAPLTVSQMF